MSSFLAPVLSLCALFTILQAQAPRTNGIDVDSLVPVSPSSQRFRRRENADCNNQFRTLDGTCSSIGTPNRQLWASTNRPHFSYFHRSTTTPTGSDLPSPRLISNLLCRQTDQRFDERSLNEMTTYFGQFVDHTIVATPQNKQEPMPIEIPHDDPIMANMTSSHLEFFRSERVRVKEGSSEERPQNSLSSVIDLVSVYGPNEMRSNALRTMTGGLLKTSEGNLLPLNTERLSNAPTLGRKFFLAGDHRANEHPVLTSIHTLFVREHNDIARELAVKFPQWDDEELFLNARRINIAQMQKITFEEWFPSITGRSLGPYTGFKQNVDPTVSIVFSTAAFRVGHTMVGNRVNRHGAGNVRLRPFNFKNIFFQGTAVMKSQGTEKFMRGALVNRAQKIDLQVTDALRNFLFTGVKGESGLDLVAINLQRCRDHACPTFNEIREQFGLRKVRTFGDISRNPNVQSALQSVYGTVDKIEAWIGLVAEDHAFGSSMGRTMVHVWMREFLRLRSGDRFFFRSQGYFTNKMLQEIPRARAVLQESSDTFREVVLRNSDIAPEDLPRRMFFTS